MANNNLLDSINKMTETATADVKKDNPVDKAKEQISDVSVADVEKSQADKTNPANTDWRLNPKNLATLQMIKDKKIYSDDEIAKMSEQDFDIINDFYGRFNNPGKAIDNYNAKNVNSESNQELVEKFIKGDISEKEFNKAYRKLDKANRKDVRDKKLQRKLDEIPDLDEDYERSWGPSKDDDDLDASSVERNFKQALDTNNYEKVKEIYDRQVADKGADSPEARGTKLALDEMSKNFDKGDNMFQHSEFTDDEISEALSDYTWSITDETTAGQYAQEVADRLGTSKERVFDIIKQQAPTQINENSNMNKIIDAYEGDYEYKEDATNWYDKLQDNEYTRLYRDDALKVAPERQNLIVDSMREYVDEKPVRGFISNDQINRYTAKLGLDKLSDEELSQMLKDIDDVGGLLAHGTSYQQGGRELDDARSAFVELVNNEARNRRGGKTREDAIRKITEMARAIEPYDADDVRGYLTRSQADFIEQAVNKYNITKDELRKISRIFNPGEYGQFGK